VYYRDVYSTKNGEVMHMKSLDVIHLIVLILIALGFIGGIVPMIGTMAMFGVIPLAIISLVFAIIQKNGLLVFSIVNLVLAIVTLIPVIGTITAIAGVVISIIAIVKLIRSTGA